MIDIKFDTNHLNSRHKVNQRPSAIISSKLPKCISAVYDAMTIKYFVSKSPSRNLHRTDSLFPPVNCSNVQRLTIHYV